MILDRYCARGGLVHADVASFESSNRLPNKSILKNGSSPQKCVSSCEYTEVWWWCSVVKAQNEAQMVQQMARAPVETTSGIQIVHMQR